jgi:ElaB/YqjD/DUF883 family membrane-anchored ribosome-binding protein
MSTSSTATNYTADNTVEALRALIREAEAALNSTSGNANGDLDDLRERLREAADEGRSMLNSLADTVRRQAGRADQAIRENPYQSIGIAAAVGLFAGFLIFRGRPGSSSN